MLVVVVVVIDSTAIQVSTPEDRVLSRAGHSTLRTGRVVKYAKELK